MNSQINGITVSTRISAGVLLGRGDGNHAEGIVVTTDLKAGGFTVPDGQPGYTTNHAEGIVVTTDLKAGRKPDNSCPSWQCGFNHAEGIVVTTRIVGGPTPQSKRTLVLKST
jgi:hypothetical protein